MVSCEIKKSKMRGKKILLYNEWLGWGVFNDSMSQLHNCAEFVIVFGRKVAIISIFEKSAIQLQKGNYSIYN